MAHPVSPDVTHLLLCWRDGDSKALEQLLPLVSKELRQLAHAYMRREQPGHLLQTTALVNEAYLRLVGARSLKWQNRAHFYGISAKLMRQILMEFARAKHSQKRGGGAFALSLEESAIVSKTPDPNLLALDEALNDLEQFDQRKARIVEMRFFGGLSVEETAEVLKIAPITVMREWNEESIRFCWVGVPKDKIDSATFVEPVARFDVFQLHRECHVFRPTTAMNRSLLCQKRPACCRVPTIVFSSGGAPCL